MRQESHLPNEGFVCRFSSEVVSPPYASVGRLRPGCQIGRFCCFPAFAGRAASLLAGVFRPPSDRVRGRLLSSGRPFGILISGVCSVGRAAPAPLRIGRVGNKCSPQLGRSRTGEELGGHGLCPRFSSPPPPRGCHGSLGSFRRAHPGQRLQMRLGGKTSPFFCSSDRTKKK